MAVAAGGSYTCAVRADGRLVCFGNNEDGQCEVPAALGPVLAVAAGAGHTCAVRADGRLVCFGNNEDGLCEVPAALGPVWQSLRALFIPVQFKPMVRYFASANAFLVNVKFPTTGKTISMFNLRLFSGLGFGVPISTVRGFRVDSVGVLLVGVEVIFLGLEVDLVLVFGGWDFGCVWRWVYGWVFLWVF